MIPSDYDGNPPLFITRRKTNVHEDVYVNNALIIKSLSNKEYLTEKAPKKKQVNILGQRIGNLNSKSLLSKELLAVTISLAEFT